jgi:hypothetical protein
VGVGAGVNLEGSSASSRRADRRQPHITIARVDTTKKREVLRGDGGLERASV